MLILGQEPCLVPLPSLATKLPFKPAVQSSPTLLPSASTWILVCPGKQAPASLHLLPGAWVWAEHGNLRALNHRKQLGHLCQQLSATVPNTELLGFKRQQAYSSAQWLVLLF